MNQLADKLAEWKLHKIAMKHSTKECRIQSFPKKLY